MGATNTVTLTVTDDAENTAEATFNVNVIDNTDPIITSTHSVQIIESTANYEASLPDYTSSVSATDNCDAVLTVTQVPVAGTAISGVTNTVTLTVTDDTGNITEVTFGVAVVDNTSPVVTSMHSDETIDADENCEASLPDYTSNVSATDNCDANLTVTQIPATGTTISGATNTVTLTVTDDTGNIAEVTFNVTVGDNTNPIITSVSNQIADANATHLYIVQGTEFDPTEISDNCEIATISNNFNNLSTLANAQILEGTTTIVWTIIDNAGNENACSFDIVVNSTVGIETLQQKGISVYPNPTNGELNLNSLDKSIEKVIISDIAGKQIITKTSIKQNETFDLSNLENGVYVIKIKVDNKTFTTKIIKE